MRHKKPTKASLYCKTDKAGVRHMPQPKPALTDFGLSPYSRT